MTTKPRIKLPDAIKAGDVIEVRTLIGHVMETGNRRDQDGKVIARNIIHTFTARFGGQEVFHADLNSGISANPFISFFMRVPAAGELELTWLDDAGISVVEKLAVTVG